MAEVQLAVPEGIVTVTVGFVLLGLGSAANTSDSEALAAVHVELTQLCARSSGAAAPKIASANNSPKITRSRITMPLHHHAQFVEWIGSYQHSF